MVCCPPVLPHFPLYDYDFCSVVRLALLAQILCSLSCFAGRLPSYVPTQSSLADYHEYSNDTVLTFPALHGTVNQTNNDVLPYQGEDPGMIPSPLNLMPSSHFFSPLHPLLPIFTG